MKIKCVIIDDEQFAIDSLVGYCRDIVFLQVAATFTDPYKARSYLERNTPDLVFLDIQMPDISGLQIAKEIRDKTMFIFTTAHSQHAVSGFNLNAVDYLLKPFGFGRFHEAIEKVKEKHILKHDHRTKKQETSFLTVKVEYINVHVDVSDILFIEAMDNYSKIHTGKKTIITLMNLKNILNLLPDNQFIRIHKSFIISKSKLTLFTKEYVVIANKTIPVGRVFSKNLMPLFRTNK
ncbi:MAG: LytTR family DNA-binding domain-containing protein [Breznakibacter sp.]